MRLLLPLLLLPPSYPRWQGRPGFYLRLADLPPLCPSLSLACPWSSPWGQNYTSPGAGAGVTREEGRAREEGRVVQLLRSGNFSLSLTGWLLPPAKEELPGEEQCTLCFASY